MLTVSQAAVHPHLSVWSRQVQTRRESPDRGTGDLETEGETGPLPAAAPHGQTVSVGEMGSLHVARLTQERSKRGQDGQMPDPGCLRLLDTVQLHHIQDLHDTVQGHCRDRQLLTAQVYAGFSLVKAVIFLAVMYGCESWIIKKAEH